MRWNPVEEVLGAPVEVELHQLILLALQPSPPLITVASEMA